MDLGSTLELVIGVVLVLVAAAVVTVTGLLRRGRGGRRREMEAPTQERLPGVGDDAETPRDSPTRTVEDVGGGGLDVLEAPSEPDPALETEKPPSAAGRLVRLRERLARSNTALGRGLLALLSRETIDEDTWDEVEETLLLADLGVGPTQELVAGLRQRVAVLGTRDPASVREVLRAQLLEAVDPGMDRRLQVTPRGGGQRPAVVLVVGVNGTGKTTTVGKLARLLVAEDKDVVLAAADTFRAAAAEQLTTWGDRVGVPTIRSPKEGADPASVAFEGVRAATELEADVLLIDTAGRLQTKTGLMDELGKLKRVTERAMNAGVPALPAPDAPADDDVPFDAQAGDAEVDLPPARAEVDEVLLVLDATTGQNGLRQAKVFSEVVSVTGIVLTKLDGTAKGGIVIAVQRELGVPVKLVGLGEGPDDLAPFDPEGFVDALIS